jgi:hypothetical protein
MTDDWLFLDNTDWVLLTWSSRWSNFERKVLRWVCLQFPIAQWPYREGHQLLKKKHQTAVTHHIILWWERQKGSLKHWTPILNRFVWWPKKMLSCLVTIKSSYHIQFNAAYPWPVFEVLFWLSPGGTDENPLKIISYSSHYQIMHLPNVREPHCCQANLLCVCLDW